MAAYLKIENPGVAPPESFTLLGASTKRNSENARNIGRFGSGNKHGIAVLLRNQLAPVVFAGNLKLEFGVRDQTVDTGLRTHQFARVQVKYGGRDSSGTNRSGTEDLGFVLEYGATDWLGVDLALREFVSNALDRAEEESDVDFVQKWANQNGNLSSDDLREAAKATLVEYRKTAKPWENVTIEVVNENQVRAKAGFTRIFIPMNSDVLNFYNNLGKWFLHFSEPELLNYSILPKNNRNLTGKQTAVIYRRGVRVREYESSDIPSLFDYNLERLELDESRKVDDWRVQGEAARVIARGNIDVLIALFSTFADGRDVWEHTFPDWALAPNPLVNNDEQKKNWQNALTAVGGENAVVGAKDSRSADIAARKGYTVIPMPDSFTQAAGKWGVRTGYSVVTGDELLGQSITDATPDVVRLVDWVWSVASRHDMLNGKEKPACSCFTKIMDAGSQTLGFYRDNTVFINKDIADGNSQQLRATVMEEVVHHITGATDNSRDFQDYLINLAVKLAVEVDYHRSI